MHIRSNIAYNKNSLKLGHMANDKTNIDSGFHFRKKQITEKSFRFDI